ncbi:MAG: peroxiredoxin family protein [bacterium]|nr:peroxiredoxin family protein [bacterium]
MGDKAPPFELAGSDGRIHRLAEYLSNGGLVIAWYPRAFTAGCTLECKSLAEDGDLIRAYGVPVVMASVDPLSENERFARETGADFPILSDSSKAIARAYGVLHQERFALRTNFFLASDGSIVAIDRNVNPATAAADIARKLGELGFERAATGNEATPQGN